MAENVAYTLNVDGTVITISADDVALDLNQYVLEQTSQNPDATGVLLSGNPSNVQIFNGTILNTKDNAIEGQGSNVVVDGIRFRGIGTGSGGTPNAADAVCIEGSNNIIRNCIASDVEDEGFIFLRQSRNSIFRNCIATDCRGEGGFGTSNNGSGTSRNLFMIDCIAFNNQEDGFAIISPGAVTTLLRCKAFENDDHGFHARSNTHFNIIIDSEFLNNTFDGIFFDSGTRHIVLRSSSIGNGRDGIQIDTGSSTVVMFNTLMENQGQNIDDSAGPNTYLGNFAFNSDAVGNPNNTNYTLTGASVITGKFVTIAQTSSFVDRPKLWHNINMLP